MPVEIFAKCISDDTSFEPSSSDGRLSSFGFSGTIAHGAFALSALRILKPASFCARVRPASHYRT